MSTEEKIRQLVEEGGGRASVELIVSEAVGLAGATGAMARRLASSAVAGLRGLGVEGDEVVLVEEPSGEGQVLALAVAASAAPTLLPPELALCPVPAGDAKPELFKLDGDDWRPTLERLAERLDGALVLALSAASARRLLKLAGDLALAPPETEPMVVALGTVARVLECPVRSADDVAQLVGSPIPEGTERAALMLADFGSFLADRAELSPDALVDVEARDLVPSFDFEERSFDRSDVLQLPETPGVYLYEDVEGEVVYVGKSKNLRRRVASYFAPKVEEREERIRGLAHGMSFERTGSELSALLREHELIQDLEPKLNVQERVHARDRQRAAGIARMERLAVVQPSASGGAELVLLDRSRGVEVVQLFPDLASAAETEAALRRSLSELARRPSQAEGWAPESRITCSWLADYGAAASIVELDGDDTDMAELLARLARDPDLEDGRIFVR